METDRDSFPNKWHTHLMKTISADFSYFCFALWCAPYASYSQRKRALGNDMSRYRCCAGYRGFGGKCCELVCPEFCLWAEVICCLGTSIQSTRFLLQDELHIRNSKCDSCIVGYLTWMRYICCIGLQVVRIISYALPPDTHLERLPCVIDAAYCSVCPCMLAQHKIELDERDRKLAIESQMEAPLPQQMDRPASPAAALIGHLPGETRNEMVLKTELEIKASMDETSEHEGLASNDPY